MGRLPRYKEKSLKPAEALAWLENNGYRNYNYNLLSIHYTRITRWGQELPFTEKHLRIAAEKFYGEQEAAPDIDWIEVLRDKDEGETTTRPSGLGFPRTP